MNTSKNEKGTLIKTLAKKMEITKGKVLTSLLTSFALCFLLFIYSTFSVFFNNSEELYFSLMDFAKFYILIFAVCTFIGFAILLITKKRLHYILFSLASGVTICAYVQSFISNLTFKGLPGDGMTTPPSLAEKAINLAIWLIVIAVLVFFCTFFKKAAVVRRFIPLVLILVTVMQIFSLIPSAINHFTNNANKFKNSQLYVLTKENQLELSEEENIIVLVLDCLDREFFVEYTDAYPDAMDEFDGFTYYDDNIAAYPRTFPALTSMLTGKTNDFSLGRVDYFEEAYTDTNLLKDLKTNGYKINLYMPIYYGYDNADVFAKYADNVSLAEGYHIPSYMALTKRMLLLSSYFWAPKILKSNAISARALSSVGSFICEEQTYSVDDSSDPAFYQELLSDGLNTDSDKKVFTFMHLRGCHPPFTMNENCEQEVSGNVTSLQQTTGAFKIVKEYINQLKELGVYENSTIIITGDHSGAEGWGSTDYYSHSMNTALLVKPKGESGTAFKTSDAQVSQDNLLAEIVKSAELETAYDYGKAYSDITEEDITTRTHYLMRQKNLAGRQYELVTYNIIGDGRNFDNWKIVDTKTFEGLYD